MFDIKALSGEVFVTALDIHSFVSGKNGHVKVYTREGTHVSHEGGPNGWMLIYNRSDVQHKGKGIVTELGNFAEAVRIPGGSV